MGGLSVPVIISIVIASLGGLFLGLACVISALHRIREGHVGVYYKYGALMEEVSPPGVHWMQPFVTEVIITLRCLIVMFKLWPLLAIIWP